MPSCCGGRGRNCSAAIWCQDSNWTFLIRLKSGCCCAKFGSVPVVVQMLEAYVRESDGSMFRYDVCIECMYCMIHVVDGFYMMVGSCSNRSLLRNFIAILQTGVIIGLYVLNVMRTERIARHWKLFHRIITISTPSYTS